MPLSVAIEGVSLAGKTTLCRNLISSPGIKYVPELSTYHNDGEGFPDASECDEAAKHSDDWFFNAELERQRTWSKPDSKSSMVIMDRSFISMIVFGLARNVLFGIGEPWRKAKQIFESELTRDYNTPVHLYLKIDTSEYHRRRLVVRRQGKQSNQPVQRVRFDEQQKRFVEIQIEVYDFLFGSAEHRILKGSETANEILAKATKLKFSTETNEHEFLRRRVDNILSRFDLPDTRY